MRRAVTLAAFLVAFVVSGCGGSGNHASNSGGSSSNPAAQALYQALLRNAIPESELPSGFYSAKTGVSTPSSRAKHHHVVGKVEIDIDSGDAGIIYLVFPSHADALADWNETDVGHQHGVKSQLAAPGFPTPALIVNSSFTGNNVFGKKVTNGVSTLVFVTANVIVDAVTISTSNTDSGDVPATVELGKLALRHLRSVQPTT